MATATICYGCGDASKDTQKLGIIQKLDYCAGCIPRVEKFLSDRDKLHEDVVCLWDKGLEALKSAVFAVHPDMSLPDV